MQALKGMVDGLFERYQAAHKTGNRDAIGDAIVEMKQVAPRVVCPACYGRSTDGNCKVCGGGGLVCPACRGAKQVRKSWIRFCTDPPAHPGEMPYDCMYCPVCKPNGIDNPEAEVRAIQEYLANPSEPWRGFNRTPEERAKAE